MKYGQSIRFTLTHYQSNQIKLLGRLMWPGQVLARDELCRRILLDTADAMFIRIDAGKRHERLLEPGREPTGTRRGSRAMNSKRNSRS
jgi:hypothetical protein